VRSGLIWLRRLVGENAFATWEEAELMEISMTTPDATSDAEALGVEPLAMRQVLGGR
jgi:NADH dehydrogenase